MSHQQFILFFLQIGVMLAVALAGGHLMRKIRQPAVLGELLGGIILGPTVFGLLAPNLSAWLFPPDESISMGLDAVLKLGMLFFLFVAGLEVKLNGIRQNRLSVATTSLFGVAVPFGLGVGAVLWWPHWWGDIEADTIFLAMFMGAALSISALPVIARILIDLKLIQTKIGVVVMAAATINDLIGWALFAMVLGSAAPGSSSTNTLLVSLAAVLGLALFILAVGYWVGQPLLRRLRHKLDWPGGFVSLIAVFILVAAALAESVGLHAIFGAFLIGVALGQNEEANNQVHDIIYQFAISFFAPLYFVSIGLKANFAANFDGWLVLVVVLIASVGKIGGASLGAWLGGIAPRPALAIGFGLNARGAMEIILASVALEYGIINQQIFVALVVMALVTSMISGPAMQGLARKGRLTFIPTAL